MSILYNHNIGKEDIAHIADNPDIKKTEFVLEHVFGITEHHQLFIDAAKIWKQHGISQFYSGFPRLENLSSSSYYLEQNLQEHSTATFKLGNFQLLTDIIPQVFVSFIWAYSDEDPLQNLTFKTLLSL